MQLLLLSEARANVDSSKDRRVPQNAPREYWRLRRRAAVLVTPEALKPTNGMADSSGCVALQPECIADMKDDIDKTLPGGAPAWSEVEARHGRYLGHGPHSPYTGWDKGNDPPGTSGG